MTHRRRLLTGALLGALFAAGPLLAAPEAHAQGKPGFHRELRGKLYPPQQIIKHSEALGLTDAQRQKIKAAIKEAQDTTLDLRFELQEESVKLNKLLDEDTIDAAKATAQADKVMRIENAIKRTHLEMLIKVKNTLDAEQKQKIKEHIERQRRRRGPGPKPPRPPQPPR